MTGLGKMGRAIAGFVLVSAFATSAGAEETFPGAIQDAAGMRCAPTCLLCHTAIPGTIQNLQQPFGRRVFVSGIMRGEPATMQRVIDTLRTNKTDTDMDGAIDVDELAAGTNPNDPDPNAELCGPVYGCGAHIVQAPPPRSSPVLWWLAGSIGLAALFAARRVTRQD